MKTGSSMPVPRLNSYFCTNRILALAIAGVLALTLFFACGENDDPSPATDERDNGVIAAAAYEAQAGALYDDLFDVALQASQSIGLHAGSRLSPGRPSLQKLGLCFDAALNNANQGVFPKTLTLDFGTGCAGADGRTRAGKVIITMSDYILAPGSSVSITLDGYSVNGIQLQGVKTIVNQSSGNGFRYSTQVTGGVIKLDTLQFGYTCNKTITQTAGMETPFNTDDDTYTSAGAATLAYPNGATAAYSTREPLEKSLVCPWTGKGKALVTFNDIAAIIDYGNGICDDSATVLIEDKLKGVRFN